MPIVGMGIDLVNVQRVERLISRNEDIFRQRVLGPLERHEISESTSLQKRVIAYGYSIAAKEAFWKALGTGLSSRMTWSDIEMIHQDATNPLLKVSGESAFRLSDLKANGIQLSLSSVPASRLSSNPHVLAMVMLTRDETKEINL